MAKIYTAQEMREWADFEEFKHNGGFLTIAEMLRQAADLMEHEEKRVKNYEYAEEYIIEGGVSSYIVI